MTLVNRRKKSAFPLLNTGSKEKWGVKGEREEGKEREMKGETKPIICGSRGQN